MENKEENISELEKKVLKVIKDKNLSSEEINKIINGLSRPNYQKYEPASISFPEKSVKFLAFSDCHIGHKDYRPDVMDKMVKDAKRQKVDFAINAGDTLEGMSGRDGHIYELSHIGASSQLDYFAQEFRKIEDALGKKFKVYSIEAQDSHGGWFKSKGNMGLNIGEEFERRSENYKFIGYDEQDLILENGLKIRLRHPGGGTAYAISYKMQKYIEGISGGQKPHMVFQGHFHKSNYLFYRNIHCYDSGCLQSQSPFMKKIGTPAHLGYWIVEAKLNSSKEKKVERVKNTFVPFFE